MKILIIRVSSIGDVIHTLPAIFFLRAAIPDASISWVVQKKAAGLLVDQPYLENVWTLQDNYLMPQSWFKTIQTIKQIRQHQWDAIIDFQGLLKTSLLLSLIPGYKYGFDWTHAREKITAYATHYHTSPNYQNIIQKNLSLASDVAYQLTGQTSQPSIQSITSSFLLETPSADRHMVDDWVAQHALHNSIILCPNTTWQSKRWPLPHWHELIHTLAQQFPSRPLILVGKDFGPDAANIWAYAQQKNISLYATPSWGLTQIAHVLKNASLLIAPDTSFLHCADFLNVPAIGLFGPTSKIQHGAFITPDSRKLALQAACPHHYQKTHAGSTASHGDCMARITPSAVFEKVKTVIE